MTISRFYCSELGATGDLIELSPSVHHHVIHVLRLKQGTLLQLFDGQGMEYEAVLTETTRRRSKVILGAPVNHYCESPLNIKLLQAICRGDRMDYALQKAIELGVNTIIPVITARCNIRYSKQYADRRLIHWRGIIISACEQSGRNILPELTNIMTLYEAFVNNTAACRLLLTPHAQTDFSAVRQENSITLLIGPEGGLSESEIEQAIMFNYKSVRLGPRVLRTETATVAALTAIQTLWGDLR